MDSGKKRTKRTEATQRTDVEEGFIPPHGGYQNLRSYQKAEIVFDATNHFCNRYIGRRDRTHDQMVQAVDNSELGWGMYLCRK